MRKKLTASIFLSKGKAVQGYHNLLVLSEDPVALALKYSEYHADELLITEELTGETHTVDLTLGIKDNFLTFMVLKKLEKSHENIL